MFRRYLLTAVLAAACVCTYAQVAVDFSAGKEGVRRYLEEVDYSADPDYTVSFVREYKRRYGVADSPQETVFRVGTLRVINGVANNMRDLGGWKVDGGHIAYGKLYRGARLDRISKKGKDIFVSELGITVDLDLRGNHYSEAWAGPVIEGVDYVKLPVTKNLGRGTGYSEERYQLAIRCIIGWLSQGRAVYFHCAEGADRTGTLAFLIEALLGVSESDLSKDYELTTFWGRGARLRNARAGLFENCVLLELITYLREYGDAKEQSINQLVLNWATTRHSPDVDPLTKEEIDLLREYLIEKD